MFKKASKYKFISITTPLNKFSLKNILEWNFQEHLNNVLDKLNNTIGLLHKLQAFLLRQSLVTVYKAFIKTPLDYGDIIYDQTFNDSFH